MNVSDDVSAALKRQQVCDVISMMSDVERVVHLAGEFLPAGRTGV